MEESVGISEYLHPELSSIRGILKQRFSDFIVREVTVEDEVVFLKDISGEELEKRIFCNSSSSSSSDMKEQAGGEGAAAEVESAIVTFEDKLVSALCAVYGLPAGSERCTTFIGDVAAADAVVADANAGLQGNSVDAHSESVESLRIFAKLCESRDVECAKEWIGFPTTEKQVRSALHQKVREVAGNLMDSTTVTLGEPSMSYVKLIAKHKAKGGAGNVGKGQAAFVNVNNRKRKDQWPESECGGNYLEFTMMKENIDTMSAVNMISKHIHAKPENILYNGTKDKRGITTQKVTVYRRKPSEFKKINAYPHQPTVRLGDFRYVKSPAKLGNLHGNRFEITLRAVECVGGSDETIALACEYLRSNGFINYFGLQRFGKGGTRSHDIGREIFKSNWKECVKMLFAEREQDRDHVRAAKSAFANQNYQEALKCLPETMYSEKFVLKKLLQNPDDWQSAFNAIGTKGSRLICAHAYQSYVFNMAASKRVKDYGLTVVEGDLVILNESVLNTGDDDDIEGGMNDLTAESDIPSAKQARVETIDLSDVVHVVTAHDIEVNKYSLDQVVLPLVGAESILPHNTIGEFIKELLSKDGMSLELFGKCFLTYRMRGGYRKVIQKAGNVEWSIQCYTDPNAELAETELNNFKSLQKESTTQLPITESSAQYKALQLKFTLPPGTYATMLLREVTKQSTESDFQAILTANVRNGLVN